MEEEKAATKPVVKPAVKPTAVPAAKVPEKKKQWKRDQVKANRWIVYHIANCDLAPEALKLLQEHEEPHVHYIQHSEYSAQEAITKGYNYSPCIFLNGKLFGSLSELKSYYNRNYFSSIQEATQ